MKRILNRYPGYAKVHLNIGQGLVVGKPTVVTTVLGSCVSVTFYCAEKKTGGIFHAILPVMPIAESKRWEQDYYKYVDTSIIHIVRAFKRRGISPDQIEAKVFGGAQTVFNNCELKPGSDNIKAAYEGLSVFKIKILASDVGGDKGRNLAFISDTGEVFLKIHKDNILSSSQNKAIGAFL